MDAATIAQVPFAGPDRVRGVLRNYNSDAFDTLHPHGARVAIVVDRA